MVVLFVAVQWFYMGSIVDRVGMRSVFGGDMGGTGNYDYFGVLSYRDIHLNCSDGGTGGTHCIPDSINCVRNDAEDMIYTYDFFKRALRGRMAGGSDIH